MIGLEIVAEEGQAETALALEGAVTGAAITTEPAQERHEMPLQIWDILSLARAIALAHGANRLVCAHRRGRIAECNDQRHHDEAKVVCHVLPRRSQKNAGAS